VTVGVFTASIITTSLSVFEGVFSIFAFLVHLHLIERHSAHALHDSVLWLVRPQTSQGKVSTGRVEVVFSRRGGETSLVLFFCGEIFSAFSFSHKHFLPVFLQVLQATQSLVA